MQKTALVIMAAGIGSRFGKGIKQLKELKLLSRQTVLMLNSKGSMYRKKRCT